MGTLFAIMVGFVTGFLLSKNGMGTDTADFWIILIPVVIAANLLAMAVFDKKGNHHE